MEPTTTPPVGKQMAWLSAFGTNGTKILHLRESPTDPWRRYTQYPQYCVPDYPIPKGSKGWATYQKLFKCGWVLISTEEAERSLQELLIKPKDKQAS